MKTINIYQVSELSKEVQEKVINNNREILVDDNYWYENTIDDIKNVGSILGIDIKDVYFSHLYCQGEGAMFEGTYQYKKDGIDKIKEYCPIDTKLHSIAEYLTKIQTKNDNAIIATVKHNSSIYHHSNTANIVIEHVEDKDFIDIEDTETSTVEILKLFMDWILQQIKTEYEYQISDSAIKDFLKTNDYYFTETGTLIN